MSSKKTRRGQTSSSAGSHVRTAGRGKGLSGARSGLWWEQRRIIGDMRPEAALVENVASGLRDWHGTVRCSLEAMGYRTASARIDAADVGAPHGRARVFVLAYANRFWKRQPPRPQREERGWSCNGGPPLADTNSERLEGEGRGGLPAGRPFAFVGGQAMGHAAGARRDEGRQRVYDQGEGSVSESSVRFAKPGLGGHAHGRASWLDAHRWPLAQGEAQHEEEPPRSVRVSVPNRKHRIKAAGNAITPQQALAAMRWAIGKMGWDQTV